MVSEQRKLGKANKSQAELKQEIEALDYEEGINTQLSLTMPFYGQKETKDKERLSELLRNDHGLGPTIPQLKAMRMTDGQARALFRILSQPIQAALNGCAIVPEEGGEAEAEFINNVFFAPPHKGGMTVTFHRFISQLLQALFDGFSAFEKVYWMPSTGDMKGKITLKKLAYRPSETITFITDQDGSFRGFRQQTFAYDKMIDVYIPKEKAFYYAAQEAENPFYGVSYFQSAYYHWDKKVKTYFTAHLAAQRSAIGTRLGTVPKNASKNAKNEFAKNIANMALNQYLLMPEGFAVESMKEGGNFDFLSYLNHHNSQMSKSVLAQFLDKDQGAGKSESSVVDRGDSGNDTFYMMLQAIMDEIASQINHYIIPDLIDVNFKGQKYPKFTWGKLTEEQKARIAKTFEKLSTSGEAMNVTPEFFREVERTMAEELGLEINYTEIEEREDREREAMEDSFQQDQQSEIQGQEEGEISLEELESSNLAGDDEVALSGEGADMIRLAYTFLDQLVEENFNG